MEEIQGWKSGRRQQREKGIRKEGKNGKCDAVLDTSSLLQVPETREGDKTSLMVAKEKSGRL